MAKCCQIEHKMRDFLKMFSFEVPNFVTFSMEGLSNCQIVLKFSLVLLLATQHSLPHYLAGIAEGTYYSRVNRGGGNAAATLGAHVKLCAAR